MTMVLSDAEIAELAIANARAAGCSCSPVVVQISHLDGPMLVQANIPHQEGCPMRNAAASLHYSGEAELAERTA